MKIISLDFNPISYTGGIARFNKNLNSIFEDSIIFLSFYNNSNMEILKNEKNLNFKKTFFVKLLNYLSRYKISANLLTKKLNTLDFSIVIFNSPSFLRSYRPENNIKTILVQHQDIDIMLKNKSNFSNNNKLISKAIDTLDWFVVFSERDKEKAICKLGFDPKKIAVIPHMTFIPELKTKKTFSRNIACICRLDNNQKRIDLVIRSMKKLTDWKLNIYGDGPDRAKLEKLAIAENVSHNVIFHGQTENIIYALDNNAIHVMTSDFEGFGMSNIEAMKRGLPLIIRDTFTSASSLINSNGVLLPYQWNENQFIKALEKIETRYSYYSYGSIIKSRNYSPKYISTKWKEIT